MNYIIQPSLASKSYTHGATLIEVIVSMFLLTFGVLGLMAAQIRSVASIGEAESRSTIAQAAENLAEGMLINPKLVEINKISSRQYPQYLTGQTPVTINLNNALPPLPASLWQGGKKISTQTTMSPNSATVKNKISKADLAKDQLATFRYLLAQTPNATSLQYVICEDSHYPPLEPTLNATTGQIVNANCDNKGSNKNSTVIKVAWTTRPASEGAKAPAYTYQIQVQE